MPSGHSRSCVKPAEAAEHGVRPQVGDGRNANTSDGVQRALGQQLWDFADYAPGV